MDKLGTLETLLSANIEDNLLSASRVDGSRLAIPITDKRVKIFKKRQDEGRDLDDLNNEDGRVEPANVSEENEESD